MISRYQRDFDFVTQAIEDGFIFLETKQEAWSFKFEKVKQRGLQRLPQINSDLEFWLLLKTIVAPLHDSHTWIGWDVPWVTSSRWGLPFEISCMGGEYFVAGWREDAGPIQEIDIGDKIISVGGLSIERIQEIYEFHEGLSTRAAQLKMLALGINQVFNYYLPNIDLDLLIEVEFISSNGQSKTRQISWIPLPEFVVPAPEEAFTYRWLRSSPRLAYLVANHFLGCCFPRV